MGEALSMSGLTVAVAPRSPLRENFACVLQFLFQQAALKTQPLNYRLNFLRVAFSGAVQFSHGS